MKKLFGLLIICSLLFSVSGALAGPDGPPNPIYLPVLMRGGGGGGQTFTVSGAVKDVDGAPVSNVLVKDLYGATDTTDINGFYAVQVQPGPNTLTATRSGYDIAPINRNVTSNLFAVNFTAQVGCGSIMVNESVTTGMGGWDFTTDQPDDVVPGTDPLEFYSPPSSGRVGINPGVDNNVLSTTKAKSQLYHIPSDADMVFLMLRVYQIDTYIGDLDSQLIEIVDKNGEILDEKFYYDYNSGGFTYLLFSLNMWKDRWVKVQFTVFNDGLGGYSTMYFDDVALVICNSHCESQVVNGNFELQHPDPTISGWVYDTPQVVTPYYSATYNHTIGGAWSMRTGIAVGETDKVAFTEVFQRNIDLPSSHSGAILTFWLLTTRIDGVVPPPEPAPPEDFGLLRGVPSISGLSSSPLVVTDTPEEDWWYVYVYDDEGDYLDRLMWEKTIDSKGTWILYRFDLSDFMGQKIQLKFGTYNDGRGGPSAVYIDDVVVGTCD